MQVNQTVNTANFFLVGNQTKGIKDNSADSSGFFDVLQTVSNDNNVSSHTKQNNDEVQQHINDDFKDKVDNNDKENILVGKSESNDSMKETDVSLDSVSDQQEMTDESNLNVLDQAVSFVEESESTTLLEGSDFLSDEELSVLYETIGNILVDVMQYFDVSIEELSTKLQSVDMKFSDLLKKDGLKEFFLNMQDIELSDLIVNNDLNQQVQSFLDGFMDEYSTLKNLVPNQELLETDENIQSFLDSLVLPEEDLVPIINEFQQNPVISDDPKVFVNMDNALYEQNPVSNMQGDMGNHNSADFSKQESKQQDVAVEIRKSSVAKTDNPILQAIQNAFQQVESVSVSEQPIQQMDIVLQVVEQVRVSMNQQQTSLELQLYPEHLGRIQIHVVSKEGVMTASIVAENEAAKQAIESGLLQLKEAMNQQNLKVEAIEVMVSTTGFEQSDEQSDSYQDNQTRSSGRKINFVNGEDEDLIEEEAEVERMKLAGNRVSFKA